MKLVEWLKYVEEEFEPEELSDGEIEENLAAGRFGSPVDYYFAVCTDPDFGGPVAVVCPIKFWEEEGCTYDQHVTHIVNIPGFEEESECILTPARGMPNLSENEMRELLSEIGLKWNNDLAALIGSTHKE